MLVCAMTDPEDEISVPATTTAVRTVNSTRSRPLTPAPVNASRSPQMSQTGTTWASAGGTVRLSQIVPCTSPSSCSSWRRKPHRSGVPQRHQSGRRPRTYNRNLVAGTGGVKKTPSGRGRLPVEHSGGAADTGGSTAQRKLPGGRTEAGPCRELGIQPQNEHGCFIESHGGRLWAGAHAGPGATLQFSLPSEVTASFAINAFD
jgi:hypothetical protein